MRLETDAVFSLVMPTRNRIGTLQRCLRSFFDNAQTPASVEVVLMCDFDDPTARDFGAIVLDPSWNVKVVFQHRSRKMIRDYNNYGSQCSTGKYVWQLNDDFEMTTRHWDAILRKRIEAFLADKPDRILYVQVDDSTHTNWEVASKWGCCCPIISRETLDAMNCFMPSEIDMWGADVALWWIFLLLPQLRVLNAISEVKLLHHSRHNDTAPPDELSHHVEAVSIRRELEDPELLRYAQVLARSMGFANYTPNRLLWEELYRQRGSGPPPSWRYTLGQQFPPPLLRFVLWITGRRSKSVLSTEEPLNDSSARMREPADQRKS